jgi:hypothetical protein
MGVSELKTRLKNFDYELQTWKDIKFIERSSDFAEVIQPNALNIIDYLELHDEFYAISRVINDIYNKLENGLCIIALQKNPGAETGLGGWRGLEKPRAYLTMDSGFLHIVKAKNFTTDVNPNGKQTMFSIWQGWQLTGSDKWEYRG